MSTPRRIADAEHLDGDEPCSQFNCDRAAVFRVEVERGKEGATTTEEYCDSCARFANLHPVEAGVLMKDYDDPEGNYDFSYRGDVDAEEFVTIVKIGGEHRIANRDADSVQFIVDSDEEIIHEAVTHGREDVITGLDLTPEQARAWAKVFETAAEIAEQEEGRWEVL